MLTLSIRQPWASLIAFSEKTVEVRSWSTTYRGPLLIHASGRDVDTLPAGYAVAVVDLVDVRPLTPADMEAACLDEMPEGCFAWVLANAREIEPFPLKGKLHLFEVDEDPVPLEGAGEEWTHVDAIMSLRAVA
jgi:hypothetical protein